MKLPAKIWGNYRAEFFGAFCDALSHLTKDHISGKSLAEARVPFVRLTGSAWYLSTRYVPTDIDGILAYYCQQNMRLITGQKSKQQRANTRFFEYFHSISIHPSVK
jgi:hypothetical protein